MKIALGIFGFIRDDIYVNSWLSFFERLKSDSDAKASGDIKIDIYLCTPNILREFDGDIVNFEYIKDTLMKNPMIENVFINKSKELNLPYKTPDNLYPYRILSLFSSISNASKEILQSNIEYDFTILTRFDMLKLVYSIGADLEIYKDKSAIYGYRADNSQIKDRFIITGVVGLTKLSKLYETYHNHTPIVNIGDEPFVSEFKLRSYLLQFSPELNIYYNGNILLGLGDTYSKYTSEFERKINEIYAP